ncbi:MAG: hypothetical protein AMXMBFR48_15470 [Ignavibacteriales bacterium]
MKTVLSVIVVGAVVLLLLNVSHDGTVVKKGVEMVTVKKGVENVTVLKNEKRGVVDLRKNKRVHEVVKDSSGNLVGEFLIDVNDSLLRYDFSVMSRLRERVDSIYITRVDTLVVKPEWYESFEFGLAAGLAASLILFLILE